MSNIILGIIFWDTTNLARSWKFDRITSIASKWMELEELLWEVQNFKENSYLLITALAHWIIILIEQVLIGLQDIEHIQLQRFTLKDKNLHQTVEFLQQTFLPPHQHRQISQTPQPSPLTMEVALYRALVKFYWDVQLEFSNEIFYWTILSHKCITCHSIM